MGLFGYMLHIDPGVLLMRAEERSRIQLPLYGQNKQRCGAMYLGEESRMYMLGADVVPLLITPGALPRKIQGPPAPMEIHDNETTLTINFGGVIPFSGEMQVYIGTLADMGKQFAETNPTAGREVNATNADPKVVHLFNRHRKQSQAAAVRYADDTIVAVSTVGMMIHLFKTAPIHLMMLEALGESDG